MGWVLGLIWLVACINSVVLVCLNSLCGGLVSYCVVGSSFVAVLCCFFLVVCACWCCCLYLRCLVGDCVVWVFRFVGLWLSLCLCLVLCLLVVIVLVARLWLTVDFEFRVFKVALVVVYFFEFSLWILVFG